MPNNDEIMNVRSLRFLKDQEIYKFILVGICSSVVVLLFTTLFTSIVGIFYAVSAIMSLEIGVVTAFFAHDRWTFKKISKINGTRIRFAKYNIFSLIGFVINELILILLTSRFGIHYIVSECIAILIVFVFNYIINKKVTWKK